MKLNVERGVEPERVELMSADLVRVPLVTPTLPPATRCNTYLVDTGAGWLVVDVGPDDPAELARLSRAIDERLGGPKALIGLVLTHEHCDHVGGLGWWAERYELPVMAHPHTIDALGGSERGVRWAPVSGDTPAGGALLLHTPGHARGHLCVMTPARDLVAGDLVAGMGTIIVAPPDGDMTAYLASLEHAMSMGPRRIFPAHGPHDDDARGRLAAYHEHRLARESRVRSAVTATPRDLMEVVSLAYADVVEAYWPLAAGSCLAHLERLAWLGEAVRDGERWRSGRV